MHNKTNFVVFTIEVIMRKKWENLHTKIKRKKKLQDWAKSHCTRQSMWYDIEHENINSTP